MSSRQSSSNGGASSSSRGGGGGGQGGEPETPTVARTASSSSSSSSGNNNNNNNSRQPQEDHDDDDDDKKDHHQQQQQQRDGLLRVGGILTSKPRTYRGYQRRGRLLQLVLALAVMLVVYQLAWQYYLAGYNIPDQDIDPVSGRKRFRRHQDRLKKYDPQQGIHVPTYV
jgi:hypothetical protein